MGAVGGDQVKTSKPNFMYTWDGGGAQGIRTVLGTQGTVYGMQYGIRHVPGDVYARWRQILRLWSGLALLKHAMPSQKPPFPILVGSRLIHSLIINEFIIIIAHPLEL